VPELIMIYGEDGEDESGWGSVWGDSGSNVGTVAFRMAKKKDRSRTSFEVAQELRAMLAKKQAFQSLNVEIESGMSPNTGKPLVVEVYGDDMNEILASAELVKDTLALVPGAVDVTVEQKPDSPEIWIKLDRRKAALMGVSTAQVAGTLRTLFYGTETTEKFWEGEDDYDIFVRMETEAKHDLGVLDRLVVMNGFGEPVRLSAIASINHVDGPSEIFRKNRQRYVSVESNIFGRSLGDVQYDARAEFDRMEFPGAITIDWGGDVSDQAETFGGFLILMILAIVLCYMVMAAQYEAYSDPLIMMLTVPFAFTGVVIVFLAMDLYISMQVILGMLMLIGVVVNHAIVYLDYVNLLRARGALLRDSLLAAAERRLRPIMMTVLAAFLGMLPLAVSNGEGSEQWTTMAICYMSGLLISTVITLVLVPVIYHLVESKLRRRPRYAEAALAARAKTEAVLQ
jgi:HAE1 family hydrophobic/amphiphilic exporter-1